MPGMLVGCCGRYCVKCPIYIASTTSDNKKKEELAVKYSKQLDKKISPDDIHCWGCRAGNRNCWGKKCRFRKCAGDKGVDFCYQCKEFTCPDLLNFYVEYPEAQENLNRICKIGIDAFISEMASGGNEIG
jgi:hypothetical protein